MSRSFPCFITVSYSDLDEILEGCRRSNRSSQYQLFSRFYNYAMSVAYRYVSNTEAAEEVTNDAFFKVFTKIHLFEPRDEGGFRAWLRRIVINTAIDRLRSSINAPATQEWRADMDSPMESGIVEQLTEEQIFSLLDQLSPAYRAVFNLFVVDGFSHEEIADTLGISIGTSKSNLARARSRLKTLLADELDLSYNV